MMSVEGLSKIFFDRASRHKHKTDGFIFQPDLPYKPFLDHNLVKWKFCDLCTVDMLVDVSKTVVNGETIVRPILKCSGDSGTYIDCSKRGNEYVGLAKFDSYRVLADCEDRGGGIGGSMRNTIAEVSYDTSCGTWIYSHLRKDKVEPNYVAVAMGVLIEQAESISIEELEYSLLAKTESENDFQRQLSNMKTKAINWQRNGRR